MRDHLLDRITETEYDESGRACRTKTHDTAGHIYTGEVDYEPATGLLSVFRAYIGTGYTRYGSTTASFVYNSDGLRIRKTVGGTVTNYTLHGTSIVHMTHGTTNLHFFYDSENRPAIVVYGGNRYGYVKNLQGDVLGLINDSGTEVVQYVYDAWGKLLATTGTMATTLGRIQPFRYRGYVYDEETGLYDLRSRYYNPEWGRFVNADMVISVSEMGIIYKPNIALIHPEAIRR